MNGWRGEWMVNECTESIESPFVNNISNIVGMIYFSISINAVYYTLWWSATGMWMDAEEELNL